MSSTYYPSDASGHYQFCYENGRELRRYMILYALAALAGAALWGGAGGVLLPLHVQQIEFAQYFTGALASVNLQELAILKNQIAAGAATASAEQQRIIDLMAAYESAKANSLAMITSIGVAVTMIVQPLIGVASDRTRSRFGRRAPWIVFGAFAALFGLVGMRYSDTFTQLLLTWIVAQVGANVAGGPLAATVVDRVPSAQRGLMSAIAGVGMLVGFILGLALAGALFGQFGIGSYLFFATALFVFCIAFVLFSRDRSSISMQMEPSNVRKHLISFTVALRDTDFRWVWIARVIMMFGYGASTTYSVYMLQSYIEPALSAAEAAKTIPLLHLAAFPGTLLAMVISGRWSDKIMRRKPFVIGASFLLSASMVVPFVWPSLIALYIQMILGGMAVGAFLVVDQALLIDVLPDKKAAGRDLGIGTLASNLGQAIGPLLAGAVLSATGGYKMIWLAALLLVAMAAFAVMPVKRAK